jgi:hypothetical protein
VYVENERILQKRKKRKKVEGVRGRGRWRYKGCMHVETFKFDPREGEGTLDL